MSRLLRPRPAHLCQNPTPNAKHQMFVAANAHAHAHEHKRQCERGRREQLERQSQRKPRATLASTGTGTKHDARRVSNASIVHRPASSIVHRACMEWLDGRLAERESVRREWSASGHAYIRRREMHRGRGIHRGLEVERSKVESLNSGSERIRASDDFKSLARLHVSEA